MAVAFILFSVLLLGFVAFAMDVGRLYVSKAELQNAADSCALSASAALTGANANQLQTAENFGITAGTRNLVGMQKVAVTIGADRDVTFSETLNGSYQTRTAAAANALKMHFVRCTLSEADIPTLMIQVVNLLPGQAIGPTTVRAAAVASLEPSKSNCALPLAMCKKAGSSAPNYGYTVGEWLVGRFNTKDNVNGKFKWVDYPGFSKTKDLKALLDGSGQCDLVDTTSLTPTQGDVNSLAPDWNWRFGVVKNSGAPDGALSPDWSGYAYDASNWLAQAGAFDDFKARRGTFTPWNNVPILSGGWKASTTAVHAAGGDRRLAAAPVVDCSTWGPGATNSQPIIGWACLLMLNPVANPSNDNMGLEYRGSAEDIDSGCVTSGAPGGPTAGGPKVPALAQ
ncbi:MAG: pilus assembly protein TadG-related protein [Bacteroidota bacterium]